MVFTNKPKKMDSLKVKDKRKISLLNADFKLASGIESLRHGSILDHTVSRCQYAAGKSKKITHAINYARDAIFSAGGRKEGAALVDIDFEAAFDFLCMEWVELVPNKRKNTILTSQLKLTRPQGPHPLKIRQKSPF